jgi:uncharacterized protein YlxW (UPF0749 family)
MRLAMWHIPLTIVFLIFGILLAHQSQTYQAKPAFHISKNQDLIALIEEIENSTFELEEEIDWRRLELSAIQEEKAGGEIVLNYLQRELNSLKDQAGLTELNGPGIILILDDNKAGANAAKLTGLENYFPNDYIVHDKNVLYLINELRGVASAISINNQRVVPGTDIRCVGTVILVNTTRLAPPYEIKALGDADRLMETVAYSQEYLYLKSVGFPIKISQGQELTIPSYRGSYRFNYAQVIQDGDK